MFESLIEEINKSENIHTIREEIQMADKMIIVHGYSDGFTSFTGLGKFFVKQDRYEEENIFYVDYSSMDIDRDKFLFN